MPAVAFLTMEDMSGFFAYDHLAIPCLAEMGIDVVMVPWQTKNVDWRQYDMVVIRSPWDYQQSPSEFLQVLENIVASGTRLQNSLDVVRWNIHKSYLRDLEKQQIPIVPTIWSTGVSVSRLEELVLQFEPHGFVIKPTIGANADDTFHLKSDSSDNLLLRIAGLFQNRELMIQPFLKSIVTLGEYSLFYFDSQYSHAILKRPASGDFRVQEEHGGTIESITPPQDIEHVAKRAIEAIPGKTLYARADVVRLSDQTPVVIELELIEPSLYLAHAATAPQHFATAIANALHSYY